MGFLDDVLTEAKKGEGAGAAAGAGASQGGAGKPEEKGALDIAALSAAAAEQGSGGDGAEKKKAIEYSDDFKNKYRKRS